MAELKTKKTATRPASFIASIKDPSQQRDSKELVTLMSRITGAKPAMWGTSIVGFGTFRYRYESGREGEWFHLGFSPRKGTMTIYCLGGARAHPDLLQKLGRCKTGVGCLYFKTLGDLDRPTLVKLLTKSFRETKRRDRTARTTRS